MTDPLLTEPRLIEEYSKVKRDLGNTGATSADEYSEKKGPSIRKLMADKYELKGN